MIVIYCVYHDTTHIMNMKCCDINYIAGGICITVDIPKAVTDSGLHMVTQHCHQLQLNISGCDQLTNLSLRHLGMGCPHLR